MKYIDTLSYWASSIGFGCVFALVLYGIIGKKPQKKASQDMILIIEK